MARLKDDRLEQIDELIKNELEASAELVKNDLAPVDAIELVDGKIGIINNNNDIVTIGGQDTFNTINQEGQFILNVNSNDTDVLIYVNNENTFKKVPSKLSYTISDVLKSGELLISCQKREIQSQESYRITIVQNPNFDDSKFNEYRPVLRNIDGNITVEPDVTRRVFTRTPPYIFKIESFINGELVNSDITSDVQNIREINFTFRKDNNNVRLPDLGIIPTTNTLTVNVTGPSRAVILERVNTDGTPIGAATQQKILLDVENTPLIVDTGAEFSLATSNTTLYRIVSVQFIPETARARTINAEDGESLIYRFTLETNSVLNIVVEEITLIDITTPTLSLVSAEKFLKYNINSKADLPIVVSVTNNVTEVTAFIKDKTYTFSRQNLTTGEIVVILPAQAFDTLGNYKVSLVPKNIDSEGLPLDLTISVVDEVFVGVPDIRNIVYPKTLIGADYSGTNVDFEISYETIDADFVKIYVNNSTGYFREKANGIVTLNFQNLLEYINYDTSADENIINLFLRLVPYNISGNEEVVGREETIPISLEKSNLEIPRNVAINRIAEGFLNQLNTQIFDSDTNKYLTHLLHLDNANNKVITTWLGDRGTIIYKLYEPLETSIQPNTELWVSKVISTPVIETVTLVGETELACNQLKGPNFLLKPDNGTEFSIYEDLMASGSVTSDALITNFIKQKGIDTSKFTIEYTSGSQYVFENFAHFSSATERLENFFYKVKLIENHEKTINSLGTGSIIEGNQKILLNNKILEIKSSFDGYEKYLYYTTDSNSNNLAYPKTNSTSSVLLNTTSSLVKMWYENLLDQSLEYDKYNANKLSNNLPTYIIESAENIDFVVFTDMLGQHFDTLWIAIKNLAEAKSIYENPFLGISNDMVSHMLESLGWHPNRAYDSPFIWEYVFGQYKDGRQKYSKPLKNANEEIWRRVLNNLPYLLKHKGTARALKAAMACYGVPQSLLTIMEFGGPQDPTKGGSTQFTFDDRTAAYYLSGSSSIKVPWVSSSLTNDYPNCIEVSIKPDRLPNTKYTIISGSEWTLDLIPTTGSFGKLELNFGGDQALSEYIVNTYFDILYVYGPEYKTGSLDFPISTEYYSNIAINRYNYPDSSSLFEVWLGTSDGNRIITSVSMSILSIDTQWSSGSYIQIGGNGFQGNIDEFRLWTVPLQRSKFNNHTLFPDAINGNSVSSSTEDLLFRLDFEYPKDRILDPYIKNVAINDTYGHASATASFTYPAPNYPYQHTPYERTVTATVPSIGFGYANKIRFESASLVTDLSYKTRSTKKAFDQAPIDSNRLGLFFSPIKEVNMDILKAFGDFNIDNYIGDPSDEYKDEYRTLSKLRNYYFERMERNINEYIQLVRYIDKSLFDVLENLIPARAKVSKGLLIEPHFLERSKTRWSKPTSEKNNYDSSITINETNLLELSYEVKEGELNNQDLSKIVGEKSFYNSIIFANDSFDLDGTNPMYDGLINYDTNEILEGNAPFYETFIQSVDTASKISAQVESFNSTQIGMDKNSIENLGFGLYAKNGVSVLRNWDGLFGNTETTGSRKNVFLVREQKSRKIPTQIAGYPVNGAQPGDDVRFENISVPYDNFVVSIQPFGGNVAIGNDVVEVTPINGYLPSHYKFKFLPEGLQRSYFKGSKQDATTTPDGLPVVETFTTNPNILRVAKTGRGSGEPILEVD